MVSTLVYAEPENPSDGPFSGVAEWFRHSGSIEACADRQAVNSWYESFPDRDGMVLSRLHGEAGGAILQAIDELYVYQLLPQPYRLSYEEDEQSLDFRLYRSSEYVAGIEVGTLFSGDAFDSEVSRNDRLVEEINSRVRSTTWWVFIDMIKLSSPRFSGVFDVPRLLWSRLG